MQWVTVVSIRNHRVSNSYSLCVLTTYNIHTHVTHADAGPFFIFYGWESTDNSASDVTYNTQIYAMSTPIFNEYFWGIET